MDVRPVLMTRANDLGADWTNARGGENNGYPVLKALSRAFGFAYSAPEVELLVGLLARLSQLANKKAL
jgi:hypothetical protein